MVIVKHDVSVGSILLLSTFYSKKQCITISFIFLLKMDICKVKPYYMMEFFESLKVQKVFCDG